ncbi:DUF305 domain-containing protein [Mycolicibacterium alvei]|uniref:DUF305 domain-containing protein n=1 Tax=Mycolicibacterium alvei TaxID=67081 RepID=UPI001F3581EE|nr:DUF305 domain-containing protein [Mycolicibacterium alvei]
MLAVLSAMAATSFLAACSGSTPDEKPQSTSETPVITGKPAGSNAGDAAFAVNMIANHDQAMQVSELVGDRSTNSDLVELAADITSTRTMETEMMKALLVQWNADSGTYSVPDHPATPARGTIDELTVTRLQGLSGQDFDVLWLQSMVAHGQGAIQIANAEIADGANVDAVGLAKKIVGKQQAEVDRMQQMLANVA